MERVELVKLFVALPTNQSKYILLPDKHGKNIIWHGRREVWYRSVICGILISGQGPPNDRIIQIKRDQRISILTYSIMASISGIGIFLAIGFFVFNIIFREHR